MINARCHNGWLAMSIAPRSSFTFHVLDLLSDLPSFDRVKGALVHHSLDKLSRSQVCSYS